MPRDAQAYISRIANDGRDARHFGEKVLDVTTHPAFKNTVASYAELYDFQCRQENLERMTFESPDSGDRVNRAWYCPRSYDELVSRREAMVSWNELHYAFWAVPPTMSLPPWPVSTWVSTYSRTTTRRVPARWPTTTVTRVTTICL